ncbi:MAG: ribosome small subunit-dependent GTPase A [Catonella sp.]
MEGRIIKAIAGFYYVHNGEEVYECKARGVFRNKGIKPLVGDIAEVEILDDENKKGNLVEIKDRKSFLVRPSVANPDQALIVFAGAKPAPNLNLLDKFLTMMEVKGISVAIAISKSDITDEMNLKGLETIYSKYYKVVAISVKEEKGLDVLKVLLKGKFTVLAGPSGVGKSTLTNYLVPDANMETGEISRKIERGKQTTRHAELFYIGEGGYICDTPGFGSLELFDVDKKELKDYFPEFAEYSRACKFNGCIHIGERDCGVKNALEKGEISESRYKNYKLIYEELANKREY